MRQEARAIAVLILSLVVTACSSSGSITSLFQESGTQSTIDISLSTFTLSASSILETRTVDAKVCPIQLDGKAPQGAKDISLVVTSFGGSSVVSIGSMAFNSSTECFEGTVTGVTAGTATSLSATLAAANLANTVTLSGRSLQVRVPRLGFTGNSHLSTPVANRIVSDVMGSWTFTGDCDPELGDVTVQGEAINVASTAPCLSNGTFSKVVNFASTSPYFVVASDIGGMSVNFGPPQVIIKQGTILSRTRIYRVPSTSTVVYVSTAAQLQGITINGGADATRAVILTADVDLATVSATNNFTRLASGSSASTRFYSSFFGDGKRISNLNMTSGASGNATYASLLGYQGGGVITDLFLENATLNSNQGSVGILAGFLRTSDVYRVSATGTVTTSSNSAGGLAGWVWDSNVHESWFNGSVTGTTLVGGLFGTFRDDYFENSWSAGTVTASSFGGAGGLIGWNYGGSSGSYFKNCFSTANVYAADTKIGGLQGEMSAPPFTTSFLNSFAAGSVTLTKGAPTGQEEVGFAIGNSGTPFFPAYLLEANAQYSNIFHLTGMSCVGCGVYSELSGLSTGKTWTQINTAVESLWDFDVTWKKATDRSSGPPTLRFNP
jgi:hypothetical protein